MRKHWAPELLSEQEKTTNLPAPWTGSAVASAQRSMNELATHAVEISRSTLGVGCSALSAALTFQRCIESPVYPQIVFDRMNRIFRMLRGTDFVHFVNSVRLSWISWLL